MEGKIQIQAKIEAYQNLLALGGRAIEKAVIRRFISLLEQKLEDRSLQNAKINDRLTINWKDDAHVLKEIQKINKEEKGIQTSLPLFNR